MALRILVMGVLLVAGASAQAPPGFKTYENKLAALTFYYPSAYSEVPLPPTEQLLVAKFVLAKTPRELKMMDARLLKSLNLQLCVFLFDTASAPATGGRRDREERRPSTVREAMEARSRISSWREFEKRLGWRVVPEGDTPDLFKLSARRASRGSSVAGYLVRKRSGSKVFGVYAYTAAPHLKPLKKIVTRVAKSMDLADRNGSADLASLRIDRIYRGGRFGAVEWRKRVRRKLAKGWKAVDTKNFLIVHHSKNQSLIQKIAREIEAMRNFYEEQFPPAAPIDKVSVVRLCQTRDEYLQYGGPQNTGGYWHPGNEELVLFDYSYTQKKLTKAEKKSMFGRKLTSKDSMLVMRHEAFHQYIHYAIGEFSPHDWFNEGYGDYFSGAVVTANTVRVRRIDPAPWRIHLAKDMCEFGDGFLSLEQILTANRAKFYNRARVAHYYAGAWSFVYFLKESKAAIAHPRWSVLLPDYFNSVKQFYAEELSAVDRPDLSDKRRASAKARDRALKSCLKGLNLEELEKSWRQWVIEMRDPWPRLRKKRKK